MLNDSPCSSWLGVSYIHHVILCHINTLRVHNALPCVGLSIGKTTLESGHSQRGAVIGRALAIQEGRD